MKTRFVALVSIFSILLIFCTGCEMAATIPYSSEEYESGEWTADELVEHFKELGFTDIEVEEYTTSDKSGEKIQVVVSEDSTSWFPAYRDFEKGETIDTLRTIIIRVTRFTTEPTTTTTTTTTTAQPTTTTTQPATTTQHKEKMVWIPTGGGTKYHSKASCSNMINPQQVTLDEAINSGFEACKRCH